MVAESQKLLSCGVGYIDLKDRYFKFFGKNGVLSVMAILKLKFTILEQVFRFSEVLTRNLNIKLLFSGYLRLVSILRWSSRTSLELDKGRTCMALMRSGPECNLNKSVGLNILFLTFLFPKSFAFLKLYVSGNEQFYFWRRHLRNKICTVLKFSAFRNF